MIWAAVIIILGQALVVGSLLYFVRTFGAYTQKLEGFTEALLRTHESNRTVHEYNVRLIDEIRKWRDDQLKKGAA